MNYLPQIVAVVIGLVVAVVIGASFTGIIGFLVLALLAGFTAQAMEPGSERIYWLAVGGIVLMILLSYFGLNISGFIFVVPAFFALTYFAARLAKKFSGQSA